MVSLLLMTSGTARAGGPSWAALLRERVELQERARTELEWHEGRERWAAAVERGLRAHAGAEAESALCDAVLAGAAEDLAVLADDLEESARRARGADLPCAAEISARVEAWWDRARGELPAARPRAPLAVRELRIEGGSDTQFGADFAPGEIALTFDDGPHIERTARVLSALGEWGARAAFLMVGSRATLNDGHRAAARAVLAAGHSAGSHSWSHPELPKLAPAVARENIRKGHDAVESALGIDSTLFRFPFGARNGDLNAFVRAEGLTSYMWAMDSIDWKLKTPAELLARVRRELDRSGRGILLFHDTQRVTAETLPAILDELQARGHTLVHLLH